MVIYYTLKLLLNKLIMIKITLSILIFHAINTNIKYTSIIAILIESYENSVENIYTKNGL